MPHNVIQEFASFFPNKYKAGGLILRTDEDKMYINTGTFAAPSFELIGDPAAPTTFVGTGAAIAALDAAAGQLAFCTATGSGFIINRAYVRNAADTAWLELYPTDGMFGDGADGNATNPTLESGAVKYYNDLTISSARTWGGVTNDGKPIIVFVAGTFNLTATLTIGTSFAGTLGGTVAGTTGGDGGDANGSCPPVIIIANEITGTGTISAVAQAGDVGDDGINGSGTNSGTAGSNPEDAVLFNNKAVVTTAGGGGQSGGGGGGAGGTATPVVNVASIFGILNFSVNHTLLHISPAAGGGAGAVTTTQCGGGGGAGGGGASVFIIANSVSAITVTVTGGAGGNGGNFTGAGTNADGGGGGLGGSSITHSGGHGGVGGSHSSDRGGGGGGGGSACRIVVADEDNSLGTATGGAGGTAAVGIEAADGNAGVAHNHTLGISSFLSSLIK
jgi:hypothetical protein